MVLSLIVVIVLDAVASSRALSVSISFLDAAFPSTVFPSTVLPSAMFACSSARCSPCGCLSSALAPRAVSMSVFMPVFISKKRDLP